MAQTEKLRLVFMGTPSFAVPSLERLAAWPGGEIAGVWTQPDRPAGRGHRLTMPEVKRRALELGLPVFQPQSLKAPEAQAELAALKPDILAVAAYGMILPQAVLDMPRLDCLNVHASLLPRYRGAAPIQRAVMEGWHPGDVAGVSIMRVIFRLDAGPVFAQASLPLSGHTSGSLHEALSVLGADLLIRVLDDLAAGKAKAVEQDERQVTYAAKVQKEDGFIVWNCPAAQADARIRGVTPWPGARVVLEALDAAGNALPPLMVRLSPGHIGPSTGGEAPGTLWRDAEGLRIACADAWYVLSSVRPRGKGDMAARDVCNGILRDLPFGRAGTARPPRDGE